MQAAEPEVILHASCVAYGQRALLITGRSGSGKSTLALSMMALGASLVADDRTRLRCRRHQLVASAPDAIAGVIEARGLGLLNAAHCPEAAVVAVVDLDRDEPGRLPQRREIRLLGQSLTLLLRVEAPHFPSSLIQFLKAGRRSP